MTASWTRWIWYAGAAAWLLSGLLSLHAHAILTAKLSLSVAVLFLAAGLLFHFQQPKNR